MQEHPGLFQFAYNQMVFLCMVDIKSVSRHISVILGFYNSRSGRETTGEV